LEIKLIIIEQKPTSEFKTGPKFGQFNVASFTFLPYMLSKRDEVLFIGKCDNPLGILLWYGKKIFKDADDLKNINFINELI